VALFGLSDWLGDRSPIHGGGVLCAARGLRGEDLTLASAITFVSLSLTEVLTSLRDCKVGMLVLESSRASFRS